MCSRAECMMTEAHVINRLPQAKLGFLSPYRILYKRKPTLSHFRVFGCVCYVFVPDQLRTKLEKKAIRCIFTGYDEQKKGWRCVDPTTNKAYVSLHVVFDEASSWWSTENVVLPDSESLDTSMRAQLPERQEVSVGGSPLSYLVSADPSASAPTKSEA